VDDGSNPSLEPIIKDYDDNRIIFIRHPENKGAGAAHNTGIKAAKYDWIAFICHDDEWLKNKLEINYEIVKKYGNEYKLLYSDIYFYKNNILINTNVDIKRGFVYDDIISLKLFFNTSTLVISKKVLEEIGYYDESGCLIDLDLYLRLAPKYAFWGINKKLIYYYFTDELSISGPNNINKIKGSNFVKLFTKHISQILKNKKYRKSWSYMLNSLAHLNSNYFYRLKMILYALLIYPSWRGNYIDFIKFLFKIK